MAVNAEVDYFKQLTANEVITIKRAGVELQDFTADQRRDEAMDTFVYALAAARALPTDYAKLMRNMIAAVESAKEPKPLAPPRKAVRTQGWIGGWRDGASFGSWRGP